MIQTNTRQLSGNALAISHYDTVYTIKNREQDKRIDFTAQNIDWSVQLLFSRPSLIKGH